MELLEQFVAGDLDAFETLFRQRQRDVYRWIVAIVRDPAAAEDLTIDAFWRIYRARARFDPGRDFGAWARRIATNVALSHLSARRPAAELPESLAADPAPDAVEQGETMRAIRRAFGELPPRLRAVASLALIEEQPHAEIAGALGISVPAVKSREFRAVRLLRKKLLSLGIKL